MGDELNLGPVQGMEITNVSPILGINTLRSPITRFQADMMQRNDFPRDPNFAAPNIVASILYTSDYLATAPFRYERGQDIGPNVALGIPDLQHHQVSGAGCCGASTAMSTAGLSALSLPVDMTLYGKNPWNATKIGMQ
jgi:hypothetical protein